MFIDFHPQTQQELQQAMTFYDNLDAKIGDTFLDATERTLQLITQLPEAWTPITSNTRRCLIKNFPYGIIYRVQSNRIQILAVMPLQRKPNYWIDRA